MKMTKSSPHETSYDFENAPCGYLTLSADGSITGINGLVLDWLGMSRAEVLYRMKLEDITPRGTGLYFLMFILPSLELQGYINEVSMEIRSRSGRTTSCLFNASAVKDDDGNISQINAILFSIQDRKKFETEILLEKKSAETVASHRGQILQAQRRIMSILGHDTRAPLFSVNRIIKLAIDGQISPEDVFPHYELMANQLDATLILIDNLLKWANAHNETSTGQQQLYPLRTTCKEVYQLLESNALAKGLFLTTQIDPDLMIKENQSIISFVVRNLVNNAIKFTGKGGVTTSAEWLDGNVRITVSDTGVGMNARQLAQYTMGELMSTTGTANETGSGMGLMLIREFLVQVKGSLEAESEPGEGSAITVVLPGSMFTSED